jgi:hypothetical protein
VFLSGLGSVYLVSFLGDSRKIAYEDHKSYLLSATQFYVVLAFGTLASHKLRGITVSSSGFTCSCCQLLSMQIN